MRIVALYDIHGNLPALEAILHDVATIQPDWIVVGGDVASGPLPVETVDCLRALDPARTCFVMGNADQELVDTYDGLPQDPELPPFVREQNEWIARQLEKHHRDFMASFVPNVRFLIEGPGEVLFCHATPRSDTEIITVATPENRLREVFAGVAEQVVVCGHTHMQFDLWVDKLRVINAGSVGMPYAAPGAYWLLLGSTIELRHTFYDLKSAADHIRATGYPQAQDFADNNVLSPPTEAEALAVFEPGINASTRDNNYS